MISKLRPLPSAVAISAISGVILPASFRTGTMTETLGGAPFADVSLMVCPTWPRRARSARVGLAARMLEWREVLMAREAARHLFCFVLGTPRRMAEYLRRGRAKSQARAPQTNRAPAAR